MTVSGLARFLSPPPAGADADATGADATGAEATGAEATGGEHEDRPGACDLCGTVLGGTGHDHLVDGGTRSLLCACRACALLFTDPGAAAGRYRLVPSRVLHDPDFGMTPIEWDALQIPVGLAFFFVNSELARWVAFYPSPAGATESVLALDSWSEVLARNGVMAGAAPDVEALLIRRGRSGFECYLAPIDACYRLVGLVRLYWKGFDGGAEVHSAIDGFFSDLDRQAGAIGTGAP